MDSKVWAIAATIAAAATLAVGLMYIGSAKADPPGCTAAGLSSALGTVASGTGAWLSAHQAANDVITNAGPTGNEQAIRDYFTAHPAEWQELQGEPTQHKYEVTDEGLDFINRYICGEDLS